MTRQNLQYANDEEKRVLVHAAIGRIMRLASRPLQPGDLAAYEEARAVILDLSSEPVADYRPNYVRDRAWRAH